MKHLLFHNVVLTDVTQPAYQGKPCRPWALRVTLCLSIQPTPPPQLARDWMWLTGLGNREIGKCEYWAGPPLWERKRKSMIHFTHRTGIKMGKAESKYHLCFVWSCQNSPGLVPNFSFPRLFCSSFFQLSLALLRLYCCSSLHLCQDSEAGSASPWALGEHIACLCGCGKQRKASRHPSAMLPSGYQSVLRITFLKREWCLAYIHSIWHKVDKCMLLQIISFVILIKLCLTLTTL